MEVDDEIVLLAQWRQYGSAGCRHRRPGLANVPIPAFNPDDEWFD